MWSILPQLQDAFLRATVRLMLSKLILQSIANKFDPHWVTYIVAFCQKDYASMIEGFFIADINKDVNENFRPSGQDVLGSILKIKIKNHKLKERKVKF